MRSAITVLTATACLLAGAARPAAAQVTRFPPGVDERTHKAIEDGLKWLADNQNADGSWRGNANAYGGDFPVAMTALAGLAFLAHGDTPERGRYARNVKLAMHYLLNVKVENGLMTSPGEAQRPMYGHGFAMLFLGELYGMESDEELARKIRKRLEDGARLIGRGQSREGGWFYTPESGAAGEDEGSVTVTAVQGLRSAKNAGIPVDKEMIDRGIEYILKCQEDDGGIRYSLRHRTGGGFDSSRPAITAAAVATLFSAGAYEKPDGELGVRDRKNLNGLRRCLAYCDRRFRLDSDNPNLAPDAVRGFMFYTHLYLAQALWTAHDRDWEKKGKSGPHWRWDGYYPKLADWLLDGRGAPSTRQPDGSWLGDTPGPGKVYGTAVALIILQIPYQYLPIWQR